MREVTMKSSNVNPMTSGDAVKELEVLGDPKRAAFVQGYFKTGPGEYGEGDRFLGIGSPTMRKLAKQCHGMALQEAEKLLHSPIHEARALGLLVLVDAYGHGDEDRRKSVFDLYLGNTRFINNWDLVDVSAPYIVGPHLMKRDRGVLRALAVSPNLWDRRIAIISTLHFIRNGEFTDTLELAAMLLDDTEDLIHKAVGWTLREVGKRERAVEEAFLKPVYRRMPRTMLRYAIERFPEDLRKRYLKGEA